MEITIGKRRIGNNERPYFIADIAANHDGDINRAYKLIELAKEAGADAAKFQNFRASHIVSRNGFENMGRALSHQEKWKKSVYEVYEDASILSDWTHLLKEKCDDVGIEYMTSPYDFESVDVVEPYVNAFKIGSGDITWTDILEYMASKKKPIILATGASSLEDVKRAVSTILQNNKNLILLQCNTNYTASNENFKYINLNVLKSYREIYPEIILGLSDHTFGHATVLGAIALGARVIEKHFTDDNSRTGPDHFFSMNPVKWTDMVERALEVFEALGDGVKKIEDNELETAVVQRRGLYFRRNMKAGELITKEDLFPLRPIPNGGIPPYRVSGILGKCLLRDVSCDDLVKETDVN